jgi:hypothetical protein
VSAYGDTVRVGSGVYAETLIVNFGISLIGSGMDSTMIDGTGISQHTIYARGSNLIEGFWIKGLGTFVGIIINCFASGTDTLNVIRNNRLSNANWEGIDVIFGRGIIQNNIFSGLEIGVGASVAGTRAIVENNYLVNVGRMILADPNAQIVARNNIMRSSGLGGLDLKSNDLDIIENNVIYNVSANLLPGIQIVNQDVGQKAYVINNTIQGDIDRTADEGIYIGIPPGQAPDTIVVINNIVTGFARGISYVADANVNPEISYNCMWNNTLSHIAPLDTGNIFVDPMFVDDTSDFQLQYASPCIDAGDPNLLDPDSSRSDIGAFGGPLGQVYIYQDLAPDVPDSLDATSEQTAIRLAWKANTESDLGGYVIYKDSVSGFPADSFHAVGIVPKDSTGFSDTSWTLNQTYYYRIAALDTAGHLSAGSPEIMVIATDVEDQGEEPGTLPKAYGLKQNYPNPFNSRTTIVYFVPNLGPNPVLIELTIYNQLGQAVRTLVKERKPIGEHRVDWDGKDDGGVEVASGVYFCRLRVWDYQVAGKIKLVLIR